MEDNRSIESVEKCTKRLSHRNPSGRSARVDVYQVITDRIIGMLESGTVPWRVPWRTSSDMPQNLITKRAYRGINSFLLHCTGSTSPFWLTFRQAQSLGGKVRRGEKACPVVFWKRLEIEEDGEKKEIPVLRYYHVFNTEQIDGLPPSRFPPTPTQTETFSPIAAAERIVADMKDKPEIRHGAGQASYSPTEDVIFMPSPTLFHTPEEFYSTLFHEAIHGSGHRKRLNRSGVTATSGFGTDPYSNEELIAEMGAAFLCGHCGIFPRTIENSAAYIQGWLKRLKNDRRLVVTAAGQAQKACDYLLGKGPDLDGAASAVASGSSRQSVVANER